MRKLGVAVACLAGLALAPAAGAATVSGYSVEAPYGMLVYTAAPGEANNVTFGTVGNFVRLDDPGALITSNDQPGGHAYCLGAVLSALCSDSDGFGLVADLGDGNDSITVSHVLWSTINGGPGNDRLVGGAGGDTLSGDAGDDFIDARDGQGDRVLCGDGNDSVVVDPQDSVSADCETVESG
jgi:Ca2+-binding RTX toxin-like protein